MTFATAGGRIYPRRRPARSDGTPGPCRRAPAWSGCRGGGPRAAASADTVLDASCGPEWSTWWAAARSIMWSAPSPSEDRTPRCSPGEGEEAKSLLRPRPHGDEVGQRRQRCSPGWALGLGDCVGIRRCSPRPGPRRAALGLRVMFPAIFSGYGPAVISASRLTDGRCDRAHHRGDGFLRRCAVVPLKETADEAVAMAPSVRRVLAAARRPALRCPVGPHPRDAWWDEKIARSARSPVRRHGGQRAETHPETPYMIIYTSGTTGGHQGRRPCPRRLSHQGAQDLAHCFDLRPGEALFWYTDLGWMMGPGSSRIPDPRRATRQSPRTPDIQARIGPWSIVE